jgi:hypothetical protein
VGPCDPHPTRLDQTLRAICRFHRLVLRGRFHRRRLLPSRHLEFQLLQLHLRLHLYQLGSIWILWQEQRLIMGLPPRQELRHAQSVLGFWHHEHHILFHHLHISPVPPSTSDSGGQGGAHEAPQQPKRALRFAVAPKQQPQEELLRLSGWTIPRTGLTESGGRRLNRAGMETELRVSLCICV